MHYFYNEFTSYLIFSPLSRYCLHKYRTINMQAPCKYNSVCPRFQRFNDFLTWFSSKQRWHQFLSLHACLAVQPRTLHTEIYVRQWIKLTYTGNRRKETYQLQVNCHRHFHHSLPPSLLLKFWREIAGCVNIGTFVDIWEYIPNSSRILNSSLLTTEAADLRIPDKGTAPLRIPDTLLCSDTLLCFCCCATKLIFSENPRNSLRLWESRSSF